MYHLQQEEIAFENMAHKTVLNLYLITNCDTNDDLQAAKRERMRSYSQVFNTFLMHTY